jgi:hypothetical protein
MVSFFVFLGFKFKSFLFYGLLAYYAVRDNEFVSTSGSDGFSQFHLSCRWMLCASLKCLDKLIILKAGLVVSVRMSQLALLRVGFFFARKILRLRPGLNPRTWVQEASALPTRPP